MPPNADRAVDAIIDRLLLREGGFVNHPRDKGKATNFGITASTLAFFRGVPSVSVEDVKNLSLEEARSIYRKQYFDAARIGLLPIGIWEQVFDIGVNSGPGVAIRMVQDVLGVTQDGVVGPATIAAAQYACAEGAHHINNRLVQRRVMMFARICKKDPGQVVFLQGWVKRAFEFMWVD